jgi:cation-transporting ATPase I
MATAATPVPQLVRASPGRARIHLPGWSGATPHAVEAALAHVPGVERVQANALTANLLVRFDPRVTNTQAVLTAARHSYPAARHSYPGDATGPDGPDGRDQPPPAPAARPKPQRRLAVQRERQAHTVRARIAVPGMDRRPHLARHVAEHLTARHPAVRAKVNMLTGRVLVEFDEHEDDLDDLCAELSGMDLPDMLDADQPADPLDPGPLVQSSTRTAGAALGLTLVSARRLAGIEHPIDTAGTARATALVGILSGFPLVRDRLRRWFGRDVADVLLSVPAIIGLALSDSPLGLVLSAAEGLRLFSEVVTRRATWRRFEARLLDSPVPVPGTVVRVASGERCPFVATVVEGMGTATGHDGLPTRVAPGETIAAGARLYGGPFVVEYGAPEEFTPVPRPVPVAPTLYSRYTQLAMPVSLAYATVTGVLSRSLTRALEGLLLVSPRTAVIGMEAAEIGAAARVLRADVTNVSTRPHRAVHFPHVLLLDGPRVLTDGFEIAVIQPEGSAWDDGRLAAHAAAVAAAAGSPWGAAFGTSGAATAVEGTFDGEKATATIDGIRYTLGPVTDWRVSPPALRQYRRGHHLLQLRATDAPRSLGYVALRPRLAVGTAELIATCRRHRVVVWLIATYGLETAHAIAERVGVPVLAGADSPAAIRSRQAEGQYVAFVSDHAHAAAAFDAADLAIGIADPHAHLPARADLIAPDLARVAAVVEAGARAELGARGSVVLSLIANGAGVLWGLGGELGLELASRALYLASLGALVWDWLLLRGGRRRERSPEHEAVQAGTLASTLATEQAAQISPAT